MSVILTAPFIVGDGQEWLGLIICTWMSKRTRWLRSREDISARHSIRLDAQQSHEDGCEM